MLLKIRTKFAKSFFSQRRPILLFELRSEDTRSFKNFLRVDHQLFQELVNRVGPRLEKRDSFVRKALVYAKNMNLIATTLRYIWLQVNLTPVYNTDLE